MSRHDFFASLHELLELAPGTLTGTEALQDLEAWNSLAVISFIAMVDEEFGVTLSAEKLRTCQTVDDLMALLGDLITV